MKFRDLSIQEKAAVIKLGVGGGLRSLLDIALFWDGMPDDPPVILKVNKSKADFVLRLKDPNREYIRDWLNPDNIATHKMSWADDGVVYPLVLNVNGRLVDFSRPPYSTWAGYDNAVRNGDTIHMTPEEAEWFTTHYKDYYPGFNKYSKGGILYPDGGDAEIYYGKYNNKRFKTQQGINDLREWISAKIMSSLSTNNSNEKEISFPPAFTQNGGTALASYLLSREPLRDMFLRHGYIQGKNKDYGFVRNAVGNRDIPVYQTAEDANVEEGNLINIGWKYNNDASIPEDTKLFHAGYYPTATYIDGKTGLIYLKSWDLNNYYNPKYYKGIKRIGSKILDLIGSPVVITTGYLNTGLNALDNNWKSTLITPQLNSYLNNIGMIKDEYGVHLPEVIVTPNEYNKGGSIHIKPENRGKFTALKKRTGHSASWFKEHGTPALRKMATFALNARKWHKHAYGGPDDPPKKRFKTPEEILAEKYGIEPIVMDNIVLQEPIVTLQMKNEYANTPLGLAEQFGTIEQAENTNAFQRQVREIRNSDNPMWFGAYFVPYLGLGMLLSNAAERIMSGQYGLGLFDTGLAFAPYLSKTLKPFIRNTRKAFEFNVNPTNANSGIRTEYPWQNWSSTTELSPFVRNARTNIKPIYDTEGNINGWESIDGKPIIETPKLSNIRLLKQPVDNPFVDANGNINEEVFNQYMNSYLFGELTTPPSNPFVANPSIASLIDRAGFTSMVHPSPIINGYNVPVRQHMLDVAKSAQSIPLPSGIDRQSFVTTALLHDIGELIGRKNHGAHGVTILENEPFIKENPLGKYMLDAINNHMTQNNQQTYDLLLALRAADASRGVDYPESRLRWPSFYNYAPLRQVYDSSKETAESNLNFINKFNEYFAKYGDPNNPNAQYPLIKADNLLDTKGINQQAKDIIARHNTFIRGVRDFKYKEDLPEEAKLKSYERMRQLGLDPDSRTDRINFTLLYYVPETGSGRVGFQPNQKYGETGVIYTSNSLGTGAGYATSQGTRHTHNGEVALVRRPYKLGANRDLWMQEGDFTLRGNTSNEGGPYYNSNKYASKFADDEELRKLEVLAWEDWNKDPITLQVRDLQKSNRERNRELNMMRHDAMLAFATDEAKQNAYQALESRTQRLGEQNLQVINNKLSLLGMLEYDIPKKISNKQLLFYINLAQKIGDGYIDSKGKMFNAIRKSKVTPYQMKSREFHTHRFIEKSIIDEMIPNVEKSRQFDNYTLLKDVELLDYLDDLHQLYKDRYLKDYIPDNSYIDFYNLPKSDELRIYSSEGIYKPSDSRANRNYNYQHYLFPGLVGEKALDLVKWINRTEWVNNPNIKVTRGHNNIGGYPEATLKTFDLGGLIKPFSYLAIPEIRY